MNSSTSSFNLRKIASGILYLVAFLLIFDRSLFFLLTSVEDHLYNQEDFQERFRRYALEKQFQTLIFGTSRTYEALHPAYLHQGLPGPVYKEAQFGKGPKYNYYFYKYFRNMVGKPKMVIYGIDYFIFNLNSNKRWLARFDKIRENFQPFSHFSMLLAHKNDIDEMINNFLILLRQGLGEEVKDAHILDFVDVQNYTGIGKTKVLVTRRPKRLKYFGYQRYPGSEGDYLLKLLKACEKDNVIVVLVILPDYYGTHMSCNQKKALVFQFTNIARKFNGVHLLNYNQPEKFPLKNEDYFLDGGYGKVNSHLSKKGSRLFHRLFLRDVRKFIKAAWR